MKTYGPLSFAQMPIRNAGAPSHNRACPRCQSAVFSVSRRFIDVCLSLFIPLRRYRCISMKCSWEGTLREKQTRLADPLIAVPCLGSVRAPTPVRIRPPAAMQESRG
jgi:hypothetical protein